MKIKECYQKAGVAAAVLMLLLSGVFGIRPARTYTITDGEKRVELTSLSREPGQILKEAGIGLSEFDTWIFPERGQIRVCRAQRIEIRHHGKTLSASSTGESVGELLDRLEITLEAEDVLSVGKEEPTFDGMKITIDRQVQRRETYTVTLPHETLTCTDDTLPEGSRRILTPGQDGELLCRADVTYRNGEAVCRNVLEESVIRQPVTEVIALGTGAQPGALDPGAMPEIGEGYIRLPTGEVLTYWKTDTVRATAYTHTDPGCDRITATGTTVHRGTVAVDPRFIPYGTRMFIVSNDGEYVYGLATAEDCGGAIKRDRMDLYFPTHAECIRFGFRSCTIYFLG